MGNLFFKFSDQKKKEHKRNVFPGEILEFLLYLKIPKEHAKEDA